MAQERVADARKAIENSKPLVAKSQNPEVGLKFAITSTRLMVLTGKMVEAKSGLEAALAEAAKYGFAGY